MQKRNILGGGNKNTKNAKGHLLSHCLVCPFWLVVQQSGQQKDPF